MVNFGRSAIVTREAITEVIDLIPLSKAETFREFVKRLTYVDATTHALVSYGIDVR
ncbi:hypothetical protein RLPCCGM1_p1772 [Rhizobium leguminosarum bv. phaseoli CCGM1]|nr:hypothetical protein RLPCCGM1_p1772 [Rhizobium leguminosarum bv. phaseoli CCGM1]